MTQYDGMGTCGNTIMIFREYEGQYKQIFETCGVVDSIGTKNRPHDAHLWHSDGRYKYTWSIDQERYVDVVDKE